MKLHYWTLLCFHCSFLLSPPPSICPRFHPPPPVLSSFLWKVENGVWLYSVYGQGSILVTLSKALRAPGCLLKVHSVEAANTRMSRDKVVGSLIQLGHKAQTSMSSASGHHQKESLQILLLSSVLEAAQCFLGFCFPSISVRGQLLGLLVRVSQVTN